jgi:hypothetical protein
MNLKFILRGNLKIFLYSSFMIYFFKKIDKNNIRLIRIYDRHNYNFNYFYLFDDISITYIIRYVYNRL